MLNILPICHIHHYNAYAMQTTSQNTCKMYLQPIIVYNILIAQHWVYTCVSWHIMHCATHLHFSSLPYGVTQTWTYILLQNTTHIRNIFTSHIFIHHYLNNPHKWTHYTETHIFISCSYQNHTILTSTHNSYTTIGPYTPHTTRIQNLYTKLVYKSCRI